MIWEPGRGLNRAVQEGVARLGAAGVGMVVVAAGDLPLASDLRWVDPLSRQSPSCPTGGGTAPTSSPYRPPRVSRSPTDPGSFARHLGEARRIGLPIRVVHSSPLAWDVDIPDDLVALAIDERPDGARSGRPRT